MPGMYTVGGAAERLNVSPRRVRALIESGQLPAERFGRQWLLTPAAVGRMEANRNMSWRPFSPEKAWSIIESLDGHSIPKDLASLDRLRRQLLPRAQHRLFYVHPGMTRDLIKHGVIGGRGAAIKAGAPVDDGNEIDLYLKAESVDRLLRKNGGIPGLEGANAVIHVVPDEVWRFDPTARFTSSWVAWLDLADRKDRAADAFLDRLVGGRIHA